MIMCLIGTPGSGKSLNMARQIYAALKPGRNTCVVTNTPLNLDQIDPRCRERYTYFSNEQLQDPKILIKFATEYWASHTAKNHNDAENRIHLYIDECQILFNNRDWQRNSKNGWPTFFSVHRHYGFYITLVTQRLGSIDKQVVGVIENYTIHRKVSNAGLLGWFISSLFFRNRLFVAVECWAPLHEKITSYFFLYRKKYGTLYNTHALFGLDGSYSDGVITYNDNKKLLDPEADTEVDPQNYKNLNAFTPDYEV